MRKHQNTTQDDKVNAVAMCYVTSREDGLDHEAAENHCYKMAANMHIDSYQLRAGVEEGQRLLSAQ